MGKLLDRDDQKKCIHADSKANDLYKQTHSHHLKRPPRKIIPERQGFHTGMERRDLKGPSLQTIVGLLLMSVLQ